MNLRKDENPYITVMNFSDIYKKENFYKSECINWRDCSNILGTNCYCNLNAEIRIKEEIADLEPSGIHFIDSGNYHYVSQFWMEKIQENFNLVVFDYHSDMQKPALGNILSCGSWVINSLETNRYLKNVILIGLGKKEKKLIDSQYKENVICIDKDSAYMWDDNKYKFENNPIYISIDKDVLSEKVVDTNWNQGEMNLNELETILHNIIIRENVIGIDICGECTYTLDKLNSIKSNDIANSELLRFLKREKNKKEEGIYLDRDIV